MGDAIEPVVRFAHYALLLGLFGWSAFWLLGLQRLDWLKFDAVPRFALAAALAAPVVSAALMLLSVASMMGVTVSALDRPIIEAMLLGTAMGNASIVRAALLVVALGAMVTLGNQRTALVFAACCYAGAILTLGWNGHAAATEGALGLFHRLINGIHLISGGLWLGAIGWFLMLTSRWCRHPEEQRALSVLTAMHAFAPTGATLVAVVAMTGTINAQIIFGLPNMAATLGTPYGVLLAIKTALVATMLVIGAYHARMSRGALRRLGLSARGPAMTVVALRHTLLAEFILGLSATGLVALFGTMSPKTMG